MKKTNLLAFLILFSAFTPNTAQSMIEINLNKIKPLTKVELLPEETFNANTVLMEEKPYEDPFLAYQIRLPKDWGDNQEPAKTLEENSLSQSILGLVAKYSSPPRQYLRSFFTLEVIELTYEIGARNWFINYILSNGMTLEQVGAEHHNQVEAIYLEVKGDITYIVRIKAIKNGPRLVFARHYLPQELYADEHIQQAQIIDSFKLINRQQTGIEKLELHGFLNQSYFDYPDSWTLRAPLIRSISKMSASLYHSRVKGKLDGQIKIFLTNKTTGESRGEAFKFYKDKLEVDDYSLGRFIEAKTMNYHSDMSFGVTQVYEMKPNKNNMLNYELWVSVMESAGYYYIISLLTPARTDEYYTWSRNEAAYKIILKGIRQKDESVNYHQFIE